MKSRERVILALNHQEPDRIPIDLGGSIVTSVTKSAYIDLKRFLGLPQEEIAMLDYVQQLPYLTEDLLQRFQVDFRMLQLPAATAPGLSIFEDGEYLAFIDRWGAKLHMPRQGGLYFDWVDFPIRSASQQALDEYQWPRPDPHEYNLRLRDQAKALYETTDYALVGSAVIGGGIFEQPARTMGLENFLMALVREPKFVDRLMDQITDIYIESCNNYLDLLGDYIQVFTFWDDVCTQDGWMIHPDLYRRLIKPKQKRLVEAIKKKTQAKLFYHSCGATFDLIPDLIDLGFDILNPVQVSACGMDSKRLKQTYGKDIVFWGGAVNTQSVLPFGKPQDVVDEARRRIDDLAPGGGFVFAAVHNIQAFVPPENIIALFDTALEYGRYQSMKPRERVQIALNHEQPDRCPMQVSFTPEFADRLRLELKARTGKSHNPHGGGNTYSLERALGEDMLLTSVGWANSYYQQPGDYTDEWGIDWRSVEYDTPYGRGNYTEISHHPLSQDQAIVAYKPPDPQRPELYLEAERVIREFKNEYWIVGVTVTTIFECAWALRGYERMLSDFLLKPDVAEAILDLPYQYHLAAAKKLVQMGVDMIWVGDDVGAQKAMLISPNMWRKFLKPRLANFIAQIKGINPQLKVAYHSDGVIYPIIPELIEIGIDVLNPIQPASMDPAQLKEQFGRELCFWGTIDEQYTLPFGSPDQVQAEVMERLNTVGRGGGLILGPTHHVQLDTPMDNFWRMVHAITETPYPVFS